MEKWRMTFIFYSKSGDKKTLLENNFVPGIDESIIEGGDSDLMRNESDLIFLK